MHSVAPQENKTSFDRTDNEVLQLFHRLRTLGSSAGSLEIRNQIVVAQRDLVLRLAAKFAKDPTLRADLEGEGIVGLLEAIDRFDPSHGVPFGAYAVHFVRGRMFAALHASRDVRFGGRVAARVQKLRRVLRESGNAPELVGDDELSAASGLAIGSIRLLRPHVRELEYLDCESPIGTAAERIETPDETCGSAPDQAFESSDDSDALRRAMTALNRRETMIIESSFGLKGPEKTSVELAAVFGISRQRVDQIKQRALEKLREAGWSDAFRPHEQTVSPSGPIECSAA